MTPTDIGAFCAHCQKEVVDFTQHTPTEIASFVSNTKGKICGRLSSAQLNEVYEYYIPVQKHNIKYAARLALGLLATSKSIAQENKQAVEIITKIQDSKNNLQITNIKGANEKITVHGKVIDGNYSIKLMKFPSKLLFKYIGYADESINIGYKSKDSLMVKRTPLEPISMGAVVVVKFNDDVYRGVKPIINHTKRKHPKNK